MRRRWQAERDTNRHVDDWLMTYADMITLLLCLFAIFLSISVAKKPVPQRVEIQQSAPPAVPAPDFLEGNLPFHGLERADRPTADAVPEAPAAGDAPPAQTAAAPGKAEAPAADAPPAKTTQDAPPVAPPAIVPAAQPQAAADPEQRGDRITSLDMSSAAFFDSGSATVTKSGEAILRDVAVTLKSDRFKEYQITVEGHTDDAPINTPQFPSNWELSTARAAAVVHFFLDQGVPARKLRAAGYADTFPKAPNRDANGNAIPENQAQNRRVVIKLEKIDKAESGAALSASPQP